MGKREGRQHGLYTHGRPPRLSSICSGRPPLYQVWLVGMRNLVRYVRVPYLMKARGLRASSKPLSLRG